MEKINIAELLRNCPKGMELDCTMFDNVTFVRVDNNREQFPIEIAVGGLRSKYLTKEGCFHDTMLLPEAKCVIFPKGKTTWEGFHRPFRDGDIITCNNSACTFVSIFKDKPTERRFRKHCSFILDYNRFGVTTKFADYTNPRFATEEEKAKLFQAIEDNGYKWNDETKTLEELLKFKDGDILTTNLGSVFILKEPNEDVLCYSCYVALNDVSRFITSYTKFCIKNGCRLATEEEKQKLFDAIKANGYHWNPETKTLEKLVEPKFKVGDRVRNKNYKDYIYDIHDIIDKGYRAKEVNADSPIIILFGSQEDNYELVPNKFDINTLKPFDKVLVRDFDNGIWDIEFFSRLFDGKHFKCLDLSYVQCIPYEGNQHLLGTTNDCDDFYKTWEE